MIGYMIPLTSDPSYLLAAKTSPRNPQDSDTLPWLSYRTECKPMDCMDGSSIHLEKKSAAKVPILVENHRR